MTSLIYRQGPDKHLAFSVEADDIQMRNNRSKSIQYDKRMASMVEKHKRDINRCKKVGLT